MHRALNTERTGKKKETGNDCDFNALEQSQTLNYRKKKTLNKYF